MRLDSIIIYSKDGSEKAPDCCSIEAIANTRDIYRGKYIAKDQYFDINTNLNIKKVNQIAKAKRENKAFIHIVGDQYFKKYILYIPDEEVEIQQKEIYQEYFKGDKAFQDKYIITFKNIEFNAHILKSRFVKENDLITEEEAKYNSVDQVESILKRLESLKNITDNYQERKKFLEDMIAQGFKAVIHSSSKQITKQLEIRSHVTRHEKSPERIALENLTEEIKKINDHWSDHDTEQLISKFNITKKAD